MADGGDGDRNRRLTPKASHSWSHISISSEEQFEATRRRELREYIIPLSVLHLDAADRKVIRIAGR